MTVRSTPAIADLLPPTADVVIVGGGITGVCTALYLAARGVKACVLDRGLPFGEASGVNAGTLGVQGEYVETIPLTRLSVDLWEQFLDTQGIDVGFRRTGGFRVAMNQAEIDELRVASAERLARWGLATEWLDRSALREAAPWLGPDVLAGTFCAEDATCSPLTAARALIDAAAVAGTTLIGHADVVSIAEAAGAYDIVTARGAISTGTLVITAGPWSSRLTRMLGTVLPTYVDIDMLTVTEPCPPLMDRLITHAGGLLSLKQFANGSLVIGGGWQGRGSFAAMEKQLDQTRLLQNLAFAARIVPMLAGLHIVRSWSGYEGVAADGMPVLGRLPATTNAYVSAITRGAYTHGPGCAALLAELIVSGETRLPIQPFAPERLAALDATGGHAA